MALLRHTLFLTLSLLLALTVQAEERILSYHADIRVETSGAMEVTETIRVRAEGREIKRGIYRDFPSKYRGRYGENIRVGFEVLSVGRDGYEENWFTDKRGNGMRVYIGREDQYLPPGEYTYQLRYRTTRQLRFFEDHDELYWNVTGNDWAFPIDQATGTVLLPGGIPARQIQVKGYTGYRGDKGQDYLTDTADSAAHVAAIRPLRTHEGLTLVVGWPKGFVHEPTAEENSAYFWQHNAPEVLIAISLPLLLAYYIVVWLRLGRDPAQGTIIPRYQPPKGYSPASLRFIEQRGYDYHAFTAAVINLAIKGQIAISEDQGGDYTLTRIKGAKAPLAPGEAALLKQLFSSSDIIEVEQSNHSTISAAIAVHEASIKRDYNQRYFVSNNGWTFLGMIFTTLTVLTAITLLPDTRLFAYILVPTLSVVTLPFAWLGRAVLESWGAVLGGKWKDLPITLFFTALLAPCILTIGGVTFFLAGETSWTFMGLWGLAFVINYGFYHWLKAPTRAGRRLLDQIEGLRLYLSVAEGDELKLAGAPKKSPQLYEALLPYAFALGVEQQWSERFAGILSAASVDTDRYHPNWYRGSLFSDLNTESFASELGSNLVQSISSSSIAPSTSGSSGFSGGSSGGGGGGGGGGGW